MSVDPVKSALRTGAAPLLRTLENASFHPKSHRCCQWGSRLAQWLKDKAVGAGVTEESEGQDTATEAMASGVDPPNSGPTQPTPPPMDAVKEDAPMEIHKPKPVHSWREFLTEIGVVVLGVCIALAAEQAVEAIHWHNKVVEAQGVIATELAGNLSNSIRRMRTEHCTEQRLDTLAQIVDAASRSGTLPPVGDIGIPPLVQWTSGAWDSVVASQTATHFPRQQLAELAIIYGFVRKADDLNLADAQSWAALHTMVGPGRSLDSSGQDRLRAALSEARYYNRTIAILGLRIVQRMENQDVQFSKDDLNLIDQARTRPLAGSAGRGVNFTCVPIGPVPATYGQAPLAAAIAEINTELKHFPEFKAQ